MLKRLKIKTLILLVSIIIIGGYFFISSLIGNPKFSNFKSHLNVEQKELIKKYIFPYKLISQQQQKISQQQQKIFQQQQKISKEQQKISQQQQKISKEQQKISQQRKIFKIVNLLVMELEKKEEGSEITTEESIEKLSNNKTS